MSTLLEIDDFSGAFRLRTGALTPILHGVSYLLRTCAITAIVGETGSGKSLMALSILGTQPHSFVPTSSRILLRGVDLLRQGAAQIRGREISMVFQDARAALNSVFTVGRQLADVYRLQHGGSRAAGQPRCGRQSRRCPASTSLNPGAAPGSTRTSSPAAWRSAR